MTNPQQVYGFLKKNLHEGFCDDCVERQTGVNRHEVNTITSTLALFPKEFKRVQAQCPQSCSNRDKLITTAI